MPTIKAIDTTTVTGKLVHEKLVNKMIGMEIVFQASLPCSFLPTFMKQVTY
jgi:sulfopyruvate decarboxylase TPP-binding subunit